MIDCLATMLITVSLVRQVLETNYREKWSSILRKWNLDTEKYFSGSVSQSVACFQTLVCLDATGQEEGNPVQLSR